MTGVNRVFTIDEILSGHAGENAEALRRNTVAANAGDLVVDVAPGYEIIDDFDNDVAPEARTGMVQAAGTATAPVYILAPPTGARTLGTAVDARAVAPHRGARILRIRSPNAAGAPALNLSRY